MITTTTTTRQQSFAADADATAATIADLQAQLAAVKAQLAANRADAAPAPDAMQKRMPPSHSLRGSVNGSS